MNAMILATLFSLAASPVGKSREVYTLEGIDLEVFLHKPDSRELDGILLVCHGVLRNAEEYRDHAVAMGNRFRLLVVAPKFDIQRFPTEVYQHGGVVVRGVPQPPERWTPRLIPLLIQKIRGTEGKPDWPFYAIGHSGGAQFVMRMSALVDHGARRVIVANAGTLLFPTPSAEFPYGFGTLPQSHQNEEALKRYLAQPITIYLGKLDVVIDEDLNVLPPAVAQGRDRFTRGRNAFESARLLARQKQWPFEWKLVEVDDVGHDHEKMFNHEKCRDAIFPVTMR